MAFSYEPLWKLLISKGIKKSELKDKLGLSSATIAKMSSNKNVSMDVLNKICDYFNCSISDVVEYKNDMLVFMESIKKYFVDCGYTLFIDRWPECRFELTQRHINIFNSLKVPEIEHIIGQFEMKANQIHQPNAGIIGTTEINLIHRTLIISGSLTVIVYFINWFLAQSQ